jgi:hypothetical protein
MQHIRCGCRPGSRRFRCCWCMHCSDAHLIPTVTLSIPTAVVEQQQAYASARCSDRQCLVAFYAQMVK